MIEGEERDLKDRGSTYVEPEGWYYISAKSNDYGWLLTVIFRGNSPPSLFSIIAQIAFPLAQESTLRDTWDHLDAHWSDPALRQQIFDSWTVLAVL